MRSLLYLVFQLFLLQNYNILYLVFVSEFKEEEKISEKCELCGRTFTTPRGLRRHNRNTCVCRVDHQHELMCVEFNSLTEVSAYIKAEEMDSIFFTKSTSSQRKEKNNSIFTTLTCNRNHKTAKEEKFPATLKISLRDDRYYLVGCLAHSHGIEPKDLRITFQTRGMIKGLLSMGLSVRNIKVRMISNLHVESQ